MTFRRPPSALWLPSLLLLIGCPASDPVGTGTPSDQEQPSYRIFALVQPGVATFSVAYDVNDAGQIVGSIEGTRSVLWMIDDAGFVTEQLDLGTPDRPSPTLSEARGINNLGQVVGWTLTDAMRPFIWTADGGMRDLGLPDGLESGLAYGINDAGQIVGSGSPDTDFSWAEGGRVLFWSVDADGTLVETRDLGSLDGVAARGHAINGVGQITGSILFAGASTPETFLWTEGEQVQRLPLGSEALALNDSEEVAGEFSERAAVWSSGALETIGPDGSLARGINNEGHVVGEIQPRADFGKMIGFLWRDGLTHLLETPSQADHARARSVNEAGLVVGESFVPGVNIGEAALWVPR